MSAPVPHPPGSPPPDAETLRRPIGPQVICVRGPSRAGKTTTCELIISALNAHGLKVAYVKRTHHLLDLPEKSSGRVWERGPSAMVMYASDRLQLTLPPGGGTAEELVAALPLDVDVVLLESHAPEAYPTILSSLLPDEQEAPVIARWELGAIEATVDAIAPLLVSLVPADRTLDRHLRAALAFHGGHGCPGLVLGTRLALLGAGELGIALPDSEKRLTVAVETGRCAADAVQAVTGCRTGRRSFSIIDQGKLAARFHDARSGRAVRVAARSSTRALAAARYPGLESRGAQLRAYIELPLSELFSVTPTDWTPPADSRDAGRVACVACGEEVVDARQVPGPDGPRCLACAGGA